MPERSELDSVPRGRREARGGQRSVSGSGWSAMAFAGSLTIGVGVAMALLLPAKVRSSEVPTVYLFAAVCGIFGMIFLAHGWQRLQHIVRRKQHLADPFWVQDFSWDPTGMNDTGFRIVKHGIAFVTLMLLILVPLHWAFLVKINGVARVIPALVLGFFDVLLLVIVGQIVLTLVRRLKFGATRVEFLRFPYSPDRPVELRFQGGSGLTTAPFLKARLACFVELMVREKGRDNSSHLMHEVLWEASGEFPIGPDGTANLRFEIPDDAHGTCLSHDIPIYWELDLSAAVPGADYKDSFLIPIYRRG